MVHHCGHWVPTDSPVIRIRSIKVPAKPPNASVERLNRKEAFENTSRKIRKMAKPYTLILETCFMAFWIPETAVATVTAATTIPTINQRRALDGSPSILEIPPEIFMNACATEPAIPAPMANKVIASMVCIQRGW